MKYLDGLVSIIIPTYNGDKFIEKTIKSCIEQTYNNIEIIVVDDGSERINMEEHLNEYITRKKIRYIYKENGGLGSARNTGLENSSGEYIQFLDDDDLLDKFKIERQIELLREHKNIYGVYCKTIYFDNENDKIIKKMKVKPDKDVYKQLITSNFFTVNSILIRRPTIKFDETLTSLEDYDFWLRLFKDKTLVYCNNTYCMVRVHGNNMSGNISRMAQNLIRVLEKVKLNEILNKESLNIINMRIFKMKYILGENYYEIEKNIESLGYLYKLKIIYFKSKQLIKKTIKFNNNIYLKKK